MGQRGRPVKSDELAVTLHGVRLGQQRCGPEGLAGLQVVGRHINDDFAEQDPVHQRNLRQH